jgi:glycosyltransferase involved in cell wall biosynthesis
VSSAFNKKQKIIILGSAHPLRGGLAAFNERLAKQFQDEQNEVIVYTFSLQYPSFLFPGTSQYTDEVAPKDLNIKIKVNSINPFNWIKVGLEIANQKPDILIVKFWLPFMGPCFGTILRLVKRNKTTKIISILDNVIPHEHRIGDKQFTQYFLKPIDGFIAMSASVKKDLHSFLPQAKCDFIPHPIYDNFGEIISKQAARAKLNIADDEKVILFFGFIRKYKGLDWILEAMKNEDIKKQNIKLLVAGEFYEDRKYYDEIIERNQLQNQLYLHTDFIPNDEVKNYFCAADCVVQPYKTATQSGISQMAYHFNKPMIVTNVGGLPEIVPHEKVGYVVEQNTDAIANAILKFYQLHKENEMVENVKLEKKKYGWNTITNSIYNLIK